MQESTTNELFRILESDGTMDMRRVYDKIMKELDRAGDQGNRKQLEVLNRIYAGWHYFMHEIAMQTYGEMTAPLTVLENYDVRLLIVPKR